MLPILTATGQIYRSISECLQDVSLDAKEKNCLRLDIVIDIDGNLLSGS